MASDHELTTLRDQITTAQYAADLAQEQLTAAKEQVTAAKDAYIAAVLAAPASHPSGFQRAELPTPPHQQVMPCQCQH